MIPELTLCADSSFDVRSTPVLTQWHIKDPVILPEMQVAGTPKYAYNLDPTKSEWADYDAVQA